MAQDMIFVTSASNSTVVINVPDMPLHRVWTKRGQRLPISRTDLERAFYDPGVDFLFRQGLLITDDKTFLKDVGLMDEEESTEIFLMTDQLQKRMLKVMPIAELKENLRKMSRAQLEEFGEYAVLHYAELGMDRVELLTKATGKDMMVAIRNHRAALE